MPNHIYQSYDEPRAYLSFRGENREGLENMFEEFVDLKRCFERALPISITPHIEQVGQYGLSVEIDMNSLRAMFAQEVSRDMAHLELAEARAYHYLQGCIDTAVMAYDLHVPYAIIPSIFSNVYEYPQAPQAAPV